MRQPKRGQLVLIDWRDIHSHAGWAGMDEPLPAADCKSVGFVLACSADAVTLAAIIGIDPGDRSAEANLRQTIPWGCVTGWRRLRTV